jgi:hypothetical protein
MPLGLVHSERVRVHTTTRRTSDGGQGMAIWINSSSKKYKKSHKTFFVVIINARNAFTPQHLAVGVQCNYVHTARSCTDRSIPTQWVPEGDKDKIRSSLPHLDNNIRSQRFESQECMRPCIQSTVIGKEQHCYRKSVCTWNRFTLRHYTSTSETDPTEHGTRMTHLNRNISSDEQTWSEIQPYTRRLL